MGAAAEMLKEVELDPKENFSKEQIERFQADPELYRNFVTTIEKEINNTFPIVSISAPMS
jgi:hypothetical protein